MDAVIFFFKKKSKWLLHTICYSMARVFFFLEHAGELHIIIIKEARSLFYINFGYV
jgi:hypothetical protein